MKEFLRSIGLVRNFTFTLNCPKSYFMNMLRVNVDDSFEMLESLRNGKAFKGIVSHDTFSIRKRRSGYRASPFFMVKLNGIVRERDNQTVVETEIVGPGWFIAFFFGVTVFIYLMITLSLITGGPRRNEMGSWAYLFLLLHAAFMLGLPYFFFRRAISTAQRDVEMEFVYLAKDYR